MPADDDSEQHTNAYVDISKMHVPDRERESHKHDHAKELVEEHFEFGFVVDRTVLLMDVGL